MLFFSPKRDFLSFDHNGYVRPQSLPIHKV